MMGDTGGESEAWASAGMCISVPPRTCSLSRVFNSDSGRQFLEAEEVLFKTRHASYWESLEAGVQCFILAIEVGSGVQ